MVSFSSIYIFRVATDLLRNHDHFEFKHEENNMVVAVNYYASWGCFDFRMDGEPFEDGFQSVPVDWKINSERKKAFFTKL